MGIPAIGLHGVQLREAAATEFRAMVELVQRAVRERIYPGQDRYLELVAVFPDRAVVMRDGRTYAYPYSIGADNVCQVGDPVEVTQEFAPVSLRESVFIEAAGEPDSGRWLIRVMRAGLSANANYYPDAVLREAAPLFEGARVFEKSDAQHVKGEGKAFSQLIGGLSGVQFIEGKSADSGEIRAVLTLIEPAGEVATKLREASARGLSGLFGFSIDADGAAKTQMREGRKVRVATSITRVQSVDLIVEPAAGGELIRMVESVSVSTHQEGDMLRTKLLHTILSMAPAVYAKLNPETATDEQIEVAYREAMAPAPVAVQTGADGLGDKVAGLFEDRLRMIEARVNARATVAGCNLPQAAKDRVLADLERRERFVEADVSAAIEAERGYLAKFTESGQVNLGAYGSGARAEDRGVKVADMLDAFFQPGHKNHGQVHSFKEAYIEITGDKRVTGQLANCDRARLREAGFREAIDTSQFDAILGGGIQRAMIADYRNPSVYDVWKPWTSTTSVPDFRSNERYRIGGYGDLAAVSQGADYAAVTSPADEKATYSATKRGGLETVTLEAIKNDDVGSIRIIPSKMSRAAKRTLSKFALDFIRSNPTIYDSVALFHSGSHGNLGSSALDATSLSAGRLAMLKQAELTSTDRLGIGPKFILVPPDLEETASNLFARTTNNDATFVNSLALTVLPIWYWTDVNDWALAADPMDIPTVEIGFLDGQVEPELFTQDNPSVGSLFTADKITYKIRHIYGGAVLDYRGLYKAVVA